MRQRRGRGRGRTRGDGEAGTSDLWHRLVGVVMEIHDESRRAIRRAVGLPAGRVRVLRRLAVRPLTLRELAEVTGSDAPATTVVVNDLEDRGLVLREVDPDNRRAKLVSLTAAGRTTLAHAMRLLDAPPAAFTTIPAADLTTLGRILDTLVEATERGDDAGRDDDRD